ncbi:hypothetical protein [Rhodoferax saidenbachensis]|uniref:hypothetical protein n=1 Tax=Rhodoferax saidenbachensis TaxID=1484693 RepID=UPI0004B958A0|nr:hypothetical protein [Rhodoferax saidenbachensis]
MSDIDRARQLHPELPGVKQLQFEEAAGEANPFEILGALFWPLLALLGIPLWTGRGKK